MAYLTSLPTKNIVMTTFNFFWLESTQPCYSVWCRDSSVRSNNSNCTKCNKFDEFNWVNQFNVTSRQSIAVLSNLVISNSNICIYSLYRPTHRATALGFALTQLPSLYPLSFPLCSSTSDLCFLYPVILWRL